MAIEFSLCVCVWNTSHLLKRSVQTYIKQDIDPARWELIVMDDSSQDDVQNALRPLLGKINLRYERLEHSEGMRGNTVAFNTAFRLARGHILAETTAECLLPRDAISQMLEPHKTNPRCFVALKTYNLRPEMQAVIDRVDWESDIMNVAEIQGWDEAWVQNNVANTHFGTHQICSIRKDVWYEITKGQGFPLYCDYGCLDGKTKVLTEDLRWVRNDSLKVGDVLVGVTENPVGKSKRKLEKSQVLSIGEVRKNSFRIITEDGRDIVSSEEHLWLTANMRSTGSQRDVLWKRTDKLKVGDEIRKLVDVGEKRDVFDSGWMAGIIDGEGSASGDSGLRVQITQNPGDVLDRAMSVLTNWGIDFSAHKRYERKGKWGSSRDGRCWDLRTRNTASALELLISAPSVRLKNKWVGIGLPVKKDCVASKIISIEPVGMRTLIGMMTSTKTFIAEGLVSHNSEDPWYCGLREKSNVMDITLPNWCMAIHQWHAPFQYWMAKGRGPRMNKFAHTMSNYMNDRSGHVPEGGTCEIWDKGSHEQLPDDEKAKWKLLDDKVLDTGIPRSII